MYIHETQQLQGSRLHRYPPGPYLGIRGADVTGTPGPTRAPITSLVGTLQPKSHTLCPPSPAHGTHGNLPGDSGGRATVAGTVTIVIPRPLDPATEERVEAARPGPSRASRPCWRTRWWRDREAGDDLRGARPARTRRARPSSSPVADTLFRHAPGGVRFGPADTARADNEVVDHGGGDDRPLLTRGHLRPFLAELLGSVEGLG